MKNIIVSKIGLIGLALAILATGVIFWLLNNRGEASTIAPNNDLTSVIASDDLVPITSAPILMYHYIRDADPADTAGTTLSVAPSQFSAQLDYLASNNYQAITLQQLADGFAGNYQIEAGKKPIILTFDDGYDDAYTQAYPILKEHKMTGIFYIITGQIGQNQRATRDQIVEMDQAGMIIGAHTVNHLNLTNIDTAKAESEIGQSKADLEDLLGHKVYDFSYPAGKYNQTTINMVSSAGFLTATTTNSGIANAGSNLFALPRIRMQNSTDLTKLLK